MTKSKSEVVGFFVAAGVPPLVFVIVGAVDHILNHSFDFYESLLEAMVWFAIFYPYSFLFASIVGLPVFLIARRFGFVTWWISLMTGMIVGGVVPIAIRSGNAPQPKELFIDVLSGGTAAFVFWLIWKRGRD